MLSKIQALRHFTTQVQPIFTQNLQTENENLLHLKIFIILIRVLNYTVLHN